MTINSTVDSMPSNRWVIAHAPVLLGFGLFGCALMLYFWKFGGFSWQFLGHLSSKKSEWGQFGDFLGGLLNPLIGLVTIWLLTISLRQNSEMLWAARRELELARVALERGAEAQKKTEAALARQIAIMYEESEFNLTLALQSKYREESATSDRSKSGGNVGEQAYRREQFLNYYIDQKFEGIVETAMNSGLDPQRFFCQRLIAVGEKPYYLTAIYPQGYVRIEDSRSDPNPFYWIGEATSLATAATYLDAVALMHQSATQAFTNYVVKRVVEPSTDPADYGLSRKIPIDVIDRNVFLQSVAGEGSGLE